MTPKKITRKALLKEPDEFITTTGRLISMGVTYQKQLSIGAAVFFALLIVFGIMRVMAHRTENQSFAALSKVTVKYETEGAGKTPTERLGMIKSDFNDFLNRFGSKSAGRIGRVIFAGICRDGGDLDTAASLYLQALGDFAGKPFYENLIRTSLGQVYAMKKEPAQSTPELEAAATKTASPLADTALFDLGLLADADGQKEKAVSYFKRILEEFPNSMFQEIVKEKVAG